MSSSDKKQSVIGGGSSSPYDQKTIPGAPYVDSDAATVPAVPALKLDAKTEPGIAPAKAAVATAPGIAPVTGSHKKVSRRRKVRLAPPPKKLEIEVAVYGDNNFYTGFERTIATGGLFVSSLETLPKGHELDVDIALEGKQIKTRGLVEFVREDNLANPECSAGAGIRLSKLSSDQVRDIEAFFSKRDPMFLQLR